MIDLEWREKMSHRANNLVNVALTVSLLPAVLLGQTGSVGHISGTVTDIGSAPVPNASVYYSRITSLRSPRGDFATGGAPTPERRANGLIAAGTSGQFAVQSLLAGDYYACVAIDHPDYIDGCKWDGVKRITVAAGQTVRTSFSVQKGRRLRIEINDPQKLLASANPGAWVAGIQTSTGAIHIASAVSDSATQKVLAITIPLSTMVKLWLAADRLKFATSSGQMLDTSGPGNGVTVPAGTGVASISLTVTGLAPAIPFVPPTNGALSVEQ
jgi:hypothetical protein